MNTVQKIVKNTSLLFISQAVSYILGFFYVIYVARYLGAEGFGILSFALAFAGILGVIVDLGLSTLTIREVARDKSLTSKYLVNTAAIRLILTVLTLLLTVLIVNIIGYPQNTAYIIYFIVLYIVFTTFSQMFYSIFQGYEKMEYQSIGTILLNVLLLGGALFAISQNLNVVSFALIYLISGAVVLVYNIIICIYKFVLPKIEIDLGFWKSTLKEALPFAITGISINIYTWIDTLMLSFLKGDVVVGWYNAAYKLIIVLLIIPLIFNTAIFPLMSRYHVSSKDALRLSFEKLFKAMMFIGIPLGVGTLLIADKIILLVYGDQFINAIIALQILIWSTVLIFARSAFERLLESVDKQFAVTKIFIVGVIFNVLANLALIPKYSYVGAGIVTVFTDIMVLVLLIRTTKNIGFPISRKILIDIGKIALASGIMGICLKYLLNLNLLVLIIISSVIYILISLIVKIIDEEEILLIKSIFK